MPREPVPHPYLDKAGNQRMRRGQPGWRLRFTDRHNARVDLTYYGSEREALRELDRQMEESAKGLSPTSAVRKVTLYDYLDSWADRYRLTPEGDERNLTTWKEHRTNVDRYLRPSLERGFSSPAATLGRQAPSGQPRPHTWQRKPLKDFTTNDVQALIGSIRLLSGAPPSESVRRSNRKTLMMAFKQAVRDGIVTKSPMADIETRWKVVPVEAAIPTVAEMEIVAARLDATAAYLGAMLRVAFFTGMRASELLGLRTTDVDWPNKTIRVRNRVTVSGGLRNESAELKTLNSKREIPILRQAEYPLGFLAERAKERKCKYVFMGSGRRPRHRGPEGAWVTESTVRSIGYGTLQKHLSGAVKAAVEAGEIREPFTLHTCRHAFATLLLTAGWPVDDVMEWMGHSSRKMTLGLYGRTRMPHSKQALAMDVTAAIDKVLEVDPMAVRNNPEYWLF